MFINIGNRIVNTFVYPTKTGYVMVDTGYSNGYKSAERKLQRRGLSFDDIKYVFLTHAHDDHAGFLQELLLKQPHIKVIANKQSWKVLLKGQNPFIGGCSSRRAFIFCQFMKLAGRGGHRFPKIDEQLVHRFMFVSPGKVVEAEQILEGKILFTPGHTADSISLVRKDYIFCGDAAMNGFPSKKRVTIWVENKDDFAASWDLLIAQNIPNIIPSHGKPFNVMNLEKFRSHVPNIKSLPLTES